MSRLKFSDRRTANATASNVLLRRAALVGVFALALLAACASTPGTIGAALGKQTDGRLFVRSVPPGQGAAQAGLEVDDEIVAIDGVDVRGMTPDDVRQAVRGELGSTMVLTVVRGGTRRDVVVKRSALK